MKLRQHWIAIALVGLLAYSTSARAADLTPSYQCVPEETVLIVRVPEARKFIDALRSQTKFGSVVLSPQRLEAISGFIQEQAADAFKELATELAGYNLKLEDFATLFDKELGFALVVEPRAGEYPLAVGLWWLEPNTDLGQRLLAAIQRGVDEQKDEQHATKRLDIDLEGNQVTHLTIPVTRAAPLPADAYEGLDDLPPEEIRKRIAELQRAADEKAIVADQMHIMLTRIGDRLLIANTFPQAGAEVFKELGEKPEKQPDFDRLTGIELAKGVFARFLKAHTGGPSGLTPRLMATPGLTAALPEGIPLVEVLGTPEPLLKLAQEGSTARVLKTLGIDRIGPAALRITLDKGALRTGLFVSAPEPRTGLLALLDQSPTAPEPPDWVPATVLSFGQLRFDLGKAYAGLRDLIVGEFGDQAKQALDMMEQQLHSVTQTDIKTLLTSAGENHYFLSFPAQATTVTTEEGKTVEMPAQRQGFVWQLNDEAPWKRLIQLGAGLAAISDGAVTAAQEQGFIGLRLNMEDVGQGGVFVGHGYMVLGIGPDVVEPLMSALRNAPQGADALRNSDLVKRAAALVPPEPSLYYDITDYDRYMKNFMQTLGSTLDTFMSITEAGGALGGAAAESDTDEEDSRKAIAKFKTLLPTVAEMEGTMGVGANQVIVNRHGLMLRGAIELPAP